ncbi:MAG TPA: isocitrate lyase/PEP mutase family protein [Burkholderiales bacterium]|nr:isocitrate lyase/PEP mutase family protein [Burkholderiales bacterium]
MNPHELQQRLISQQTIWTACGYDALTAKLVEAAGFDAVTSSGYGIAASLLGQPDLELYSMAENLGVVRNMAAAIAIPLIADIDNGYGEILNVMRTVREFEAAGAAAMFMEDQASPKKCPQLGAPLPLVPLDEAVAKIKAALAARRSPHTTIIARTDALALEDVIARAKAYVEAGAHLIMPIGRAMRGIDDLRALRTACGVPLVLPVNAGGTLDCSRSELESVAGCVMYPLAGLMTATQALKENLAELCRSKSFQHLPRPMMKVPDFQEFIGYPALKATRDQFVAPDCTP